MILRGCEFRQIIRIKLFLKNKKYVPFFEIILSEINDRICHFEDVIQMCLFVFAKYGKNIRLVLKFDIDNNRLDMVPNFSILASISSYNSYFVFQPDFLFVGSKCF